MPGSIRSKLGLAATRSCEEARVIMPRKVIVSKEAKAG